jgi:hypothetical protein
VEVTKESGTFVAQLKADEENVRLSVTDEQSAKDHIEISFGVGNYVLTRNRKFRNLFIIGSIAVMTIVFLVGLFRKHNEREAMNTPAKIRE